MLGLAPFRGFSHYCADTAEITRKEERGGEWRGGVAENVFYYTENLTLLSAWNIAWFCKKQCAFRRTKYSSVRTFTPANEMNIPWLALSNRIITV